MSKPTDTAKLDDPLPPTASASRTEDQQTSAQKAHSISINLPPGSEETRPPPIRHISNPAYKSPIRHHQRTPSRSSGVKETLNARSHYGSGDDGDGASVHRINQYVIKQEIGRGSFGSVHLAEDQYGREYAVKEFSKSRLRKRAQSNLLRRPNAGRRPGQIAAGMGFNSPLHRLSSSTSASKIPETDSLNLIKEEIAIMKKLNHNNLVALIEVLDDPQEDSLYMVLEMCKKGVAMHVGLEERAEPYDDETCRCWFRDMILGIEYLHAQGIIHRDIKPDNCLITSDDVLKIVDFGVSEMFEKASEMATAKSAGSPAFMAPELCVAQHGQISGRAADIWSMGVTLYCMRYGCIPFEKSSMLDLYESIRKDDFSMNDEGDANFVDLMLRMLEKDPERRITMDEIRDHPWVTKSGADTLLSAEENCADLIEPPTEIEKNHAITGNMGHVMAVVGAAKRFKTLLHNKRGRFKEGLSIFGASARLVQPPGSISEPRVRSEETDERKPMESILTTEGVNREIEVDDSGEVTPKDLDKKAIQQTSKPLLEHSQSEPEAETLQGESETQAHYRQRMETLRHRPSSTSTPSSNPTSPDQNSSSRSRQPRPLSRAETFPLNEPGKGHAHDPTEDLYFLHIGTNPTEHSQTPSEPDVENPVVSESPPAVEYNIYEAAYQEEMHRIRARRGDSNPSMYLTRRIEHREDIRSLSAIKDTGRYAAARAADAFDGLYKQSSAKGEWYKTAGTNAARDVAGKVRDRYWPAGAETEGNESQGQGPGQGVESVRGFAKSAATEGYANASEKLGAVYGAWSSSGSVREGFSNVVAQARAQARGDAGAKDDGEAEVEVEKGESEAASGGAGKGTTAETPSLPAVANLLSAKSTESGNTGAVKGPGLL